MRTIFFQKSKSHNLLKVFPCIKRNTKSFLFQRHFLFADFKQLYLSTKSLSVRQRKDLLPDAVKHIVFMLFILFPRTLYNMNLLVNRRLFPVPIVDRNTNVLFIALGQGQALSLHAQGEIHSKHHLDIVGATIVSPVHRRVHRRLFPVRFLIETQTFCSAPTNTRSSSQSTLLSTLKIKRNALLCGLF